MRSGVFGRHQDHRNPPAEHLCRTLDPSNLLKMLDDFLHHFVTLFHMSHFPASKLHRKLNLMPLFKKLDGLIQFDLPVMVVDFRADSDFFERNYMLFFLAFLGLAFLLIQKLAVIHNPAYRRIRRRRHFHQVQTCFPRAFAGFFNRNNTDLLIVFVNQPNRTDTNPLIDPKIDFFCDKTSLSKK